MKRRWGKVLFAINMIRLTNSLRMYPLLITDITCYFPTNWCYHMSFSIIYSISFDKAQQPKHLIVKTSWTNTLRIQFQRFISSATSILELSLLLSSLGDNWEGGALMVFTRVCPTTRQHTIYDHICHIYTCVYPTTRQHAIYDHINVFPNTRQQDNYNHTTTRNVSSHY